DDDFFELGGSSLVGLQILSRLRSEFAVELPLRSFFEARTVRGMAQSIEGEGRSETDPGRLEQILAEIEAMSEEEAERNLGNEIAAPAESLPAGQGEPPRPLAAPPAAAARAAGRGLEFGILFFSADGSTVSRGRYDFVLECARIADRRGFKAVWTPERHFVEFGGLYPNPSVLGAALAMITERIEIRAGSVVLPLHHPVRIAEDWAVVDNLSAGRVALSCASGWHPDDFVIAPERYEDRKEEMFRAIDLLRRLWSGETVRLPGPGGEIEVRTLPRPVQPVLPLWVTTSGSLDTWERSGTIGANLLAAMGSQSVEELARRITLYREARARAGHDPAGGLVSLMLHTYVGDDVATVRRMVRGPLGEYLKTHLRQRDGHANVPGITADDERALTDLAVDHYLQNASLVGTVETCSPLLERLAAAGVDEIACLVDFGLAPDAILAGLDRLDALRQAHAAPVAEPVP
ncbi:MAG: MupA/Atu3671 family FMN-dependent luciferase-like monooxygenase, partial [Candidatus Eisenbacteria bacterium]